MLYAIEKMNYVDSENLFKDLETLEHGTLQMEGICCVIANYRKSAETVASLAKDIRENLYLYNDEMVISIDEICQGWKLDSVTVKQITGSAPIKCRKLHQDQMERIVGKKVVSKKVVDLLMSMEDDLREMQKIVADEENDVVELITKEMEVTVADAMYLNGLRKMIDITTDMACALVCIMQVTNRYVDIFYDSEKMKKVTGCSEIKYRGLCK